MTTATHQIIAPKTGPYYGSTLSGPAGKPWLAFLDGKVLVGKNLIPRRFTSAERAQEAIDNAKSLAEVSR